MSQLVGLDNAYKCTLLSASLGVAVSGQAGSAFASLPGANYFAMQGTLNYGTGGTSANFTLQTTFDSSNWFDIANLAFSTFATSGQTDVRVVCVTRSNLTSAVATSGILSGGSINNGILGDQFRVLWGNAGTYTSSTVVIIGLAKA